jgi:hypothetical protein
MNIRYKTVLAGILFLLVVCYSTQTVVCYSTQPKNASESYEYWDGSEPPDTIELLKGSIIGLRIFSAKRGIP